MKDVDRADQYLSYYKKVKKLKISLLQAVEVLRVARGRGSRIT
jgi:hypothetical protein